MNHGNVSERHIRTHAEELLAYTLYRKGTEEDAGTLIKVLSAEEDSPERLLFLGELYSWIGKWDLATEYLQALSDTTALNDTVRSRGSNQLLEASVYFSEKEEWAKAIKCLGLAQKLFPDNPLFNHVPQNFERDLPVAFFQSGAFSKAIEFCERDLKAKGYLPEKVHFIAIACQCLLENECELSLQQRAELLEKVHMYWTALSNDSAYWRDFYVNRALLYGTKISNSDFLRIAPNFGVSRCEALLDQLKDECGMKNNIPDPPDLEKIRTSMEVERHSAGLLSKLLRHKGSTWPKGGLKMLAYYWGREEFEREFDKIRNGEIGSDQWLLEGLKNEATCLAFIHFLNGAHAACIRCTENTENSTLLNLMGLALIAKAETALKSNNFQDCSEIAEKIPNIKDTKIRKKAEDLLDDMASKRVRTALLRGEREEAIAFAQGVLEKTPLPKLKSSLCGTFLKRSENRFLTDDLDGFQEDFDQALQVAVDRKVCENHLSRIVRFQFNKLFSEKNIKKVFELLDSLMAKYPDFNFLTAQHHLFLALEKMSKSGAADASVINNLEKAYDINNEDKEIATLYSIALSSKAVQVINTATSGHASIYSIQNAVRESELLLIKALRIDPTNAKAKENLMTLGQIATKVGISISSEALNLMKDNFLSTLLSMIKK